MSRHNRRRTRGGHRSSAAANISNTAQAGIYTVSPQSCVVSARAGSTCTAVSSLAYPPGLGGGYNTYGYSYDPSSPISTTSGYNKYTKNNNNSIHKFTAQHWQNRYLAWKPHVAANAVLGIGSADAVSDRSREPDRDCGSMTGEDDGLEEKMHAYFEGLDFIDW